MRDGVLERDPTYRWLRDRAPRPMFRCPVCLAVPRRQWSTEARSPLGRELYVVTCDRHYCRDRAQGYGFQRVDQTAFGAKRGNCFSACVAMILELPLAEVPWFMGLPDGTPYAGGDWWVPFVEWCRVRGWVPLYYSNPAAYTPPGFAILGGPSPANSPSLHAVLGYDGRIVHDPNPTRRELLKITDAIIIVPTAPPEWSLVV